MMAHLLGQEVIIEIFKACRLCGLSNSDRFPIVHLENGRDKNKELNKIIRETVLIEVRDRDKMPPLICEVCIDKVHQFYEFRESVLSTDLRIRTRLGLPSQEEMFILDSADIFENETILGDTVPVTIEPVTTNSERKYRPGPKSKKHTLVVKDEVKEKRKPKNVQVAKSVGKKKGEPQNNKSKKQNVVREEKSKTKSRVPRELLALQSFAMSDIDLSDSSRSRRESRSSGAERRAATPPARVTRSGAEVPSKKTESPPPLPPPPLKSILKNSSKKDQKTKPMLHQQIEDNLASRKKRQRDQPQTPEAPAAKKIRLTIKLPPPPPPPPPPADPFKCQICGGGFQTKAALSSHLRRHVPNYTDPKLCCTACRTWFPELAKAIAHHSKHGPYRCKRCAGKHRTREMFDEHITQKKCLPWEATPDVRCPECWASFITQTLCDQHQCKGVAARPVKCDLCGGQYATAQTLRKHRKACSLRYKGKPSKIPAAARRRFQLAAVRLRRCDPLLPPRGRLDARTVTQNFDLDKKYIYPFNPFGREVKETLRFNTMVSIREDAKNFLYKEEDYVHWDSDMSTDSEDELDNSSKSRVDSLNTLSLKTIFSKQFLGKVPRKLRKVKSGNIFDSIFNSSKADSEFTSNIDSIINHLDSEVDGANRSVNDSCGYDSDSLLNNCEKSVVGDASVARVVYTSAYLKQGNVDTNSLKDSLKGLNDCDSGVNLGKNYEDSFSNAENRKENDDETSAEENNDESNANGNDFNDNSQSTDRTDYDDASQNGDDDHEKVNGSSYDSTKALLDELDAQIGDRGVVGKEGNVANKGKDTGLDNISDTEFDFK